jgi:hypothetical protein
MISNRTNFFADDTQYSLVDALLAVRPFNLLCSPHTSLRQEDIATERLDDFNRQNMLSNYS